MSKQLLVSRIQQTSVLNPTSYTSQVNALSSGASTLSGTDSGDFLLLNATSGSAITLPALSAGQSFTFLVGATAGSHTIAAPSAIIVGSVCAGTTGGNVCTIATPKTTITLAAGADGSVPGDLITIRAGLTRYHLTGSVARFAGITLA